MKTATFVRSFSALLFVCLLFAFNGKAQKINYPDSWSHQGFNLTSSENTGVRLIHSVNDFSFSTATINGEEMTLVHMPGNILPNEEGAPNLPGEGRYIAIPNGAIANLKITNMRVETFYDVDIAPSPRIPFENDNSPVHYEKNMQVYSQNAFYPAEPIKLSEPSKIRGLDVVMLGITPFQYNPVSKELKVLRDIEVGISFVGGDGNFGDTRYRSRWWDPILADAVMNFEALPVVDHNRIYGNNKGGDGCEYLIITPDGSDYVYWADSIAMFRNKQGILTQVVTLTEVGGNTTSDIESFVNNAYTNWTIPPSAVLLLGDFGTDINKNVISPIYNSYCASDNIYADVDNDHLPEMAFARITANDSSQLATMVTKFIEYETNPPTNPDFYDNPITAIGWQTERWFQICGEAVGGYWKNELGKNTVRINDIYSGSPGSVWSTATNTSTVVDYFGPNGLGYIPSEPSILGGWTGGNSTAINNTINNGCFIMLHRDHGSTTGWGEPSYNTSSINGLTNTELTFVMSINCLTGKYNMSGECFAEKFHRYTYNDENSGALGITAASEISYSFVNDTYVWGFIDNMWPEFMPDYGTTYPQDYVMPAFGNAAGKIFLEQSNWPYNTGNKQVTYHLFHHHGGAFLTLYYEVPMNLTVVHDGDITFGSTAFEITADAGSLISLFYNGDILATATGTGTLQSITIPAIPLGEEVSLTITKQNYFRYEQLLPVLDPLTSNFMADLTTGCQGEAINFTDLSVGDPISWLWTFEGGSPATSTDQHPQGIIYSGLGDFDVSLEVSSTTGTATYTNTDYISIVDNIVVTASITASTEHICQGDEVTFDLLETNGGLNPVYQWKLNGANVGDGSTTFVTSSLENNDQVECEVTSSYSCAAVNPLMSNTVIMTVDGVLPVTLTINCDTNVICEGEQVIFDAFPVNGGDDPQYQWMLNGENCGTNDPYYISSLLENGDIVSCKVYSNALCIVGDSATSDPITMTVMIEPEQLSAPTGPTYIDLHSVQTSDYATIADPGATSYVWSVSPVIAWENMEITLNAMTVYWAEDYMGEAMIRVYGANDCGDGEISDSTVVIIDNTTGIDDAGSDLGVSIFPNPNSGTFKLKISGVDQEIISYSIRNSIGEQLIAEEQLHLSGTYEKTIDLTAFSEGIYFLIIRKGDTRITEKIILQQ